MEFFRRVFCLVLRQDEHGSGPVGDGVVLLAAVEGYQPGVRQRLEALGQHAVGVGDVFVDLRAGVAPGEAGEFQRAELSGGGLQGQREGQIAPGSPGAADSQHALVLAVQIDEHPALQIGAVQPGGPQQADLLVYGKHRLDGRVGDGVIVQQGQHHGHRRAVIAPQGGVLRPKPVAVQDQRQRVLFEIVVCAGGLDAYHVRVPLEDHRRMPLVAGGGVLPDDYVAQLVPAAAEAPRSGEVLHPRADGVRVPRLPGDAAQFLEKPEYVPGLQMG